MKTQPNLAARRRDPDLIGAEAAMRRAGRRARERADQLARGAAKKRWGEGLYGLRGSLRSLWSFFRRL